MQSPRAGLSTPASLSSVCPLTGESDGRRTITLSQQPFLLRPIKDGSGSSPGPHWSVPLQVRSGANGTLQSVLLTRDGQRETAGLCSEPLSINSGAIGYFPAEYEAAH